MFLLSRMFWVLSWALFVAVFFLPLWACLADPDWPWLYPWGLFWGLLLGSEAAKRAAIRVRRRVDPAYRRGRETYDRLVRK